MKKIEKIKRQYETEVIAAINCDICKAVSKSDDWTEGAYEIKETVISMEIGKRFPEGGSSEMTSFDICPKCFVEKLIPWIASQGGSGPTVKEIDY